jgi:hypothetical protein
MLIAGVSFTVLMYSVKRMPRRGASTTSRGGRAARKSSKRFAGAEEDPIDIKELFQCWRLIAGADIDRQNRQNYCIYIQYYVVG